MNCRSCGTPILPGESVCRNCGTPVVQPVSTPQVPNPATVQNTPTLVPLTPLEEKKEPVVEPPKKGKGKILVALLLAVIIVVVGVLVVPKLMNQKGKETSSQGSNTEESNTNTNKPLETTFEVIMGDFIYNIPLSYAVNVENGMLNVYDDSTSPSVRMAIGSKEGSFDSLITLSSEEIQNEFLQKGAVSASVNKQTVNGKQYIVVNLTKDGQNIIYACTKANAENLFYAYISTDDNTFGTRYLKELDVIFVGALAYEQEVSLPTFE